MKLRLSLVFLCVVAFGGYKLYRHFTSWEFQFQQSQSLVLYSVYPGLVPTDSPISNNKIPNVDHWNFIDKRIVSAPDEKEQLFRATQQTLTDQGTVVGKGLMARVIITYASCFSPRHAVSTADGKTILLLCFECGKVEIITPQGVYTEPINRKTKPLFDSLIRKYGMKEDKV